MLAVTGTGGTIRAARKAAYAALANVSFDGMQMRRDIGHRALGYPVRIGVLGSTRGTAMQVLAE